jgi:nitrogenase molybdenum-iron protein alpha/beta subunit
MKGLHYLLPPLAADYTGICSAIYDLDAMIVLHNPGGCMRTVTDIDEPRWASRRASFFSSGLNESNVIFGDDDAFFRNIVRTFQGTDKKFIALVSTPVPAVIGMDMNDIATRLESSLNVPVFAFNTTGFENYSCGITEAYLALAKHYLSSPQEKKPTSVNILGATPLDTGSDRHLNMLVSLLEQAGLTVNAVWTMGSRLEDISRSSCAELNIVISHTALPLAQFMEEHFGIPYIQSLPVGMQPSARFFALIDKMMQGTVSVEQWAEKETDGPELPQGSRALIIGEPVMSYGIRQCLINDFGVDEVQVASLLPLDMIPGTDRSSDDLTIGKEEDLENLIGHNHFDIIVGDPYFRNFVNAKKQTTFIALPHIALSGNEYYQSDYAYFGEPGYQYFCKSIFQ